MSLPVALAPGTKIGGQYIVGDLINSGGFGAVYRGIDSNEGNRPCAIKETYNVTPAARRQALMEASVLFTVRSKHLPEVYDALEANGRFYLVMQLIEGQNLLQILQARVPGGLVGENEPHHQLSHSCSELEVMAWLLPILDVLQELHRRNPPILHRDIKPGNIILTPQQTTVLVDFGLTKLYDPAKSTQTMVKAVSEGFSPVEQYVGQTCPQSDIYSMAATMYLLLTNRLPPASLSRTMRDDLIVPRLLSQTISPKMERALLKALAVNAGERYQSMGEFAEALREPAFSAHADATIAVPPAQTTPTMQQVTPQPSFVASYANAPAPYPYISGSNGSSHPAYPQMPPAQSGASYWAPHPAPSYQPQRGKNIASAPDMAPRVQAPVQPDKSTQQLPSPSNQGCLWGGLQGILGALVVLSGNNSSGFFLATLIALIFYTFAGFMTTWRGGGSFRGARAGYCTCLVGALFFWFSLGVGLTIKFGQELKTITALSPDMRRNPGELAGMAWKSTQPPWPNLWIMPQKPFLLNIIVWVVGGIVVAWILGWIGGQLGAMRYRSKMARKQQGPAY